MGRIMLATSNNTDEEYGGTNATQKDEISVTPSSKLSAGGTSVKAVESNGITTISGYFTLSSAVSNNDVLFTLGSNDMVLNYCYSSAYGPNDKRIALAMSKNSNNLIVSGNPVVATAQGETYGFTMTIA